MELAKTVTLAWYKNVLKFRVSSRLRGWTEAVVGPRRLFVQLHSAVP